MPAYDNIDALIGPPMHAVANAIRGMICAPKGRKLIAADFSQIEARVNPWLAGEEHVVDAFRAYDRKEGPDIYKVTAAGVYSVPAEAVTKDQRQVGKVATLALGFGGGPVAFAKMAKNYALDVGDVFEPVHASASDRNLKRAEDGWKQRGKQTGMSEARWRTAELIKLAWREANPQTVAMWKALEEAAMSATREPGETFTVGAHIRYKKAGSFLWCRLPSGRKLCYPYPRIEMRKMPWGDPEDEPVYRPALMYKGVNSVTKKWSDQPAYGGLLMENCTQAVARDVMVRGMIALEKAGYEVVLTVHDEVVNEVDEGFGSIGEVISLITQPVEWAPGLPIAADGFEAKRYRK